MRLARCLLLVCASIVAVSVARAQMPAAPAVPSSPAAAPAGPAPTLAKVLDDVRLAYNRQERPMVVFDLDGTLFDNRSRHLQILREYAERELKTVRPDFAQRLLALTVPQVQYRLTDTLTAAGVTEPAVVNNAAVFWSERFFHNDYLRFDTPNPQAVAFVRSLYSSGARIVYLTARDMQRQLIGTTRSLYDAGYPIGIQGTELIMRPQAQVQDAVFKQSVTNYLRQYGKVIATFDNETSNANMFRRAFGDALVFLVDAPASPNQIEPLAGVTKLARFE